MNKKSNDNENPFATVWILLKSTAYKQLMLLLLLGLQAQYATGYDFMEGGIAYNINPDGKSVTVTYQHSVEYNTPSYSNASGSLSIPASVKHGAITYSVTSIGYRAFYNCSGFTGTLTIPNSVTAIGSEAFSCCSGFTGSLTIPNSVTIIGSSGFYCCSGFTGSLTIPNSVTTIGYYAFLGCSGFTGSLTIGNSVTEIGSAAFSGCSGFTGSLTIPNSVTTIDILAFKGCSGFTGSLTIPNSVTEIDGGTFWGCSGFTGSLTIPNSVTFIGEMAFYCCSGFTGVLTIPNSVTEIVGGAFRNCSGFTGSLTIPNSVTTIDDMTFAGCSGITEIIVGNSVTAIGDSVFSRCNLKEITIPASVRSLGHGILRGNQISKITCLAKRPPTAFEQTDDDSGTFNGIDRKNCFVYVPTGYDQSYWTATGWKEFENIIEINPVPEVRGDLDGNGVVDIDDLNTIINIMLGKESQ